VFEILYFYLIAKLGIHSSDLSGARTVSSRKN